MINNTHGSTPPLRPLRASLSNVMGEATSMPSTDSGNSAARHSGSPWHSTSSYMWE